MKDKITPYELHVLDRLAVAADQHRQTQTAIVELVELVLAIDSWDENKRRVVRDYVAGGALSSLESFLETLGVVAEVH